MQNQEVTKMEFLLTNGGNIIIQRHFNVRNYNPDSRYSWEIYEVVKKISNEISNDLKQKNFEYMCDNQEFIYASEPVEKEESWDKENFLLQIGIIEDEVTLASDVFISRILPTYYFHPKVRYTVDIRPKIRRILAEITEVLSADELTLTQHGYELYIND